MKPALNLGAWRHLDGSEGGRALWLPAPHLVTHGVVLGMTESGKAGLVRRCARTCRAWSST
jgi:hypothetical protein